MTSHLIVYTHDGVKFPASNPELPIKSDKMASADFVRHPLSVREFVQFHADSLKLEFVLRKMAFLLPLLDHTGHMFGNFQCVTPWVIAFVKLDFVENHRRRAMTPRVGKLWR